MIGNSPALVEVLRKVEVVAPLDSTVLILGETGSGKELVARAIHDRSSRKGRPLVKVNCGAISAGLVESELFGHVKGTEMGDSSSLMAALFFWMKSANYHSTRRSKFSAYCKSKSSSRSAVVGQSESTYVS
jgi:transcriptional regulator with AAA-type ATPase domain